MRTRDRLRAAIGFTAVAVAIFAVGGVLRGTQAAVAGLAALALCTVAISRKGLGRLSPLVALYGVAAALCVVQLLPLPGALLRSITPTVAALREDGAELLDLSPWYSLTADAGGTFRALIHFSTLLAIAVVALRIATTERGRYRLMAAIGILCGLVAFSVGIHHLFGLKALYGIYEPKYAQPRLLGPLLNMNSLACLMAVGAVTSVGLAAYGRQPSWLRALWLLVVAACGAISVAAISRGATLALIAGGLVTVGALVAHRITAPDGNKKRTFKFVTNGLPLGVVVTCAIVLVIYSNARSVEQQLNVLSLQEMHEKTSKFAAWESSLTLVEESPWTGVGRGAFDSSFTRVHPASGAATYSHLENEYLEAVVDWGIPGALILGACGLWLAYVAARRWRDGPLAAGALGALTVLGMQSTVDFGVQFLGLALPGTVLAATLAYVPLRDIARRRLTFAARGLHVVVLVAGGVLLLSERTRTLEEDHLLLSSKQELSLATIRESLERHPLDYYGYALAAQRLDRTGDPRAIRLLNHALQLHPTHPGLHRLAAQMLARTGFAGQAAIEYAAALRSTDVPTQLVPEILARFTPEQAASAFPVDFVRPDLLFTTLMDAGRDDVARLWLEHVLDQRPKDLRACEYLFAIASRDHKIQSAELAVHRCAASMPDYQARLALAQTLAAQQGNAVVIELLKDVDTWQTRVDEKIAAWLLLCDARAALGDIDEAKRCLRRLDASADMRVERREEILRRIEQLQKSGVRERASSAVPPL